MMIPTSELNMKEIIQTTCFSHLEVVFMFHPVPLLMYYLQAVSFAEHIPELTAINLSISVLCCTPTEHTCFAGWALC